MPKIRYDKGAMVDQISALRATGLTYREIAAAIGNGISRRYVQALATLFGIQGRKWSRAQKPVVSEGSKVAM